MKYLFLCTWLCVSACTYAPDEDFFKEIAIPDNPTVTISLNDIAVGAAIEIYQPTSFTYHCSIDGGTIEQLQVLLDDQLLATDTDGNGQFLLDYSRLVTGTHELKIQFLSSSGSGSLADKLGAEKYEVWATWTLVVDMSPPPAPSPVISNENGVLKISWDPYTKSNFVSYRVYWYDNFNGNNMLTITDPLQTSVLIDKYVGGYNMGYTVELVASPHTVAGYGTLPDQVNLDGTWNYNDSTVQLAWDLADYSSAFKSYTLLQNDQEIMEIADINQTSLHFKPDKVWFGLPLTFQVRVNAKQGYSPGSDGFIIARPVQAAKLSSLPDFFSFHNEYKTSIGVSTNEGKFVIYNGEMQQMQEKTVSFPRPDWIIPLSGPHIYYSKAEYGIGQRNLDTNAENDIDIMTSTSGGILNSPRPRDASGNGIVVVSYSAHNSSGFFMVQHVAVYNIENKKRLYHAESGNIGESLPMPSVSTDGKYLFIPGKGVYKITDSAIEFLFILPANHNFYGFRQDDSEEIITLGPNNTVFVYASVSGALLRSIAGLNGGTYRGYDPYSRHLLWVTSGETLSLAVHIDTKEERKIYAYTTSVYNFRLVNGNIIDNEGFFFKAIPE